jgi:hypothetical protein
MRLDNLVCANCAGRVSEGRCSQCRATRDRYGRDRQAISAPLWLVLTILTALVCALALRTHYA